MMHAATCYGLIAQRRRRAFFLTRTTQHVETIEWLREVTRAVVALGALAAWAGVLLLLAV